MDKKFNKFKKFFSTQIHSDDWNSSKYLTVKSKLMLNNTYSIVGITKQKYGNMLYFAKNILSEQVTRYKELPEEYVNDKILLFGFSLFLDDEKPTNFEPLTSLFTDNNWKSYDIVIPILNSELCEDSLELSKFSLYTPDYFYKEILPNKLRHIKNIKLKNEIEGIYYSFSKTPSPYTICILNNIPIYETDAAIKDKIIQYYIESFFIKTASILKKHSKDINAKECFQYSSNYFALIPIESNAYTISERNKGFFVLKTNYLFNIRKKITIPITTLKKYSCFYDKLQIDDSLDERIQRCIHWLGLSALNDNITDSFVQISIAVESLLTNSKDEIAKNLSLRLSSLLAIDDIKRKDIKKKIYELYDKRSKIIHEGKNEITNEDKELFFNYVFNGVLNVIDLIKQKKIKNTEELYSYPNITQHSK